MDFSLISDWLVREGGYLLRWWLLVTLAGAAAWPLLYRVMGGLPDRGYTLARPAGLMLTGFVFWFLGSLGLLRNTPGGMVFAWVLVLLAGLAAFLRWEDRPPVGGWLRDHAALVILTEAVFFLLFVGWAAYRAHNPEMASTEKPMEVMFINSIRASETFPPHDAWLSGYAISYYYFGYVLLAMLGDLSSLSTGYVFTMGVALIFALTGTGALGMVYNLVMARRPRRATVPGALASGLLGLCFVVLMGNLGTALVEFPYQGYASGLVNADYFNFWDVPERQGSRIDVVSAGPEQDPIEQEILLADRDSDGVPNWEDDPLPLDSWTFTWGLGWRYSRIINDKDLNGNPVGAAPINEFPNFSFVLADLHPHVLALPFALLAIGLALNLVLNGRDLTRAEYPLYAILVGGMVFMNSWDAVYLPFLIGAETLRRLIRNRTGTLHLDDLYGIGRFALIIGALTLVFYLPWLITFTSQAGGVLPNLINPTPWQQFFLQFGTFLVIVTVYMFIEMRRAQERFNWQAAGWFAGGVALVTVLFAAFLGLLVWERGDPLYSVWSVWDTSGGMGTLIPDVLARRLTGLPSQILLLSIMALVVGRLFARPPQRSVAAADIDERDVGPDMVLRVRAINYSPATGFALLLIGAAATLTFLPDFVYLRDNFSVRINTVFKLYYQGWVMFSVASAFAVWSVLAGDQKPVFALRSLLGGSGGRVEIDVHGKPKRKRGLALQPGQSIAEGQILFSGVVALFVAAGMLYPLLATQGRALVETGRIATKERIEACEAGGGEDCPELTDLTLDGAPTMISSQEYAAAQCLDRLEQNRADAILVEAPCRCGYHPEIARFATLTGIPTLMGWGNHEGQWRGAALPELIDTRFENGERRDRYADVETLYITQDWDAAWRVIDRYKIDYIVVGNAERNLIQELIAKQTDAIANAQEKEDRRQQLQQEYAAGLEKFDQVMTPVCDFGTTTVFRVAPE